MKYAEPRPVGRSQAETIFASGSESAICHALIGVTFHDQDWRWVQDQCLRLIKHPAPDVRGLAAACLGHLARIHGRLDLDIVKPALEALLKDPAVGGRARDALGDIRVFMEPDGGKNA